MSTVILCICVLLLAHNCTFGLHNVTTLFGSSVNQLQQEIINFGKQDFNYSSYCYIQQCNCTT